MTATADGAGFGHAAFRGNFGIARREITPEVGGYCRNWGAAQHDVAESIHRPLFVSVLVIHSPESERELILIDADLGWWKTPSVSRTFLERLRAELGVRSDQLIFGLTHTHAGPTLMEPDASLPGYEKFKAWFDALPEIVLNTVRDARQNTAEGTLEWATGRCALARNRDLPDPDATRNRWLCGYNPDASADDVLMLGRITDPNGQIRGTIVNYACHPTTLAWQNKSISPDYIGAMRETIEQVTQAPALFLLGMCGELAPRYQYVGETEVADAHGRELGFAALSTLSAMEPPGTRLEYAGVMESGAPLALWQHRPASASSLLRSCELTVEVPLKDWPSASELEERRAACPDRALQERLRRKRDIRLAIGDGTTLRLPITIWRVGDAVFIGCCCEAYSVLQRTLRSHFKGTPVICMNLINGSLGYLPPAELYSQDIYTVWQTPLAQGALEIVTRTMMDAIHDILK